MNYVDTESEEREGVGGRKGTSSQDTGGKNRIPLLKFPEGTEDTTRRVVRSARVLERVPGPTGGTTPRSQLSTLRISQICRLNHHQEDLTLALQGSKDRRLVLY